MAKSPSASVAWQPLDQAGDILRAKYFPSRIEQACTAWVPRSLPFHSAAAANGKVG